LSSSAKQEVLKMIQRKKNAKNSIKSKSASDSNLYKIVADFIKEMDAAITNSKSFIEFDIALSDAAKKLDRGVLFFDPDASIIINWNKDADISNNWKDLQVEGITIKWGNRFAKVSKRNIEENIDLGHLLLEGYFG